MQMKELDFKIIKLMNSDARYDIIHYLMHQIAATVAILVSKVELTDQAIRNFLKQLEKVNFLHVYNYKLRGGRWITIYHLIDRDFSIPDVVKLHLATRKKRDRLYDYKIIFILDVPFKRYFDENRRINLTNEKLNLKFSCSLEGTDGLMGLNTIRIQHGARTNEDRLIIEVKRELRQLQKRNPFVLEQFLVPVQNKDL